MPFGTVSLSARIRALLGCTLLLAQPLSAAAFVPDDPMRRPQASELAGAVPEPTRWDLAVSGYAYHLRHTQCRTCERTDHVPGLGARYRLLGDSTGTWSVRLAAGVQNDSFRNAGYFAGVTAQRTHPVSWGTFEYGLGVFALRRTFSPRGNLEWMVAPLPVLSFKPYRTRWGLNVLAAPNFQHDGRTRSGFVFFQLSYALGPQAGQ